MSSDSPTSLVLAAGISLVFLNDPSRLQVNQSTRANLLRQQEDVGSLLLECFYCSDVLVKKEDVSIDGIPMSIRMKISSRLLGKKPADNTGNKFWHTCPCCSSVTCEACLSHEVLEGSSNTLLHICAHCFTHSSRVRHPTTGLRVGAYHSSDPKVFHYMWDGFKHTYQKSYPTPSQEAHRGEIFANNLLRIDVLNENASIHQLDASTSQSLAGINQYTDFTGSEYHDAVLARSRVASELILLECHESRTDIQALKRRLSDLILQHDFQQFNDSQIDRVISDMQSLVNEPLSLRSLSFSSSSLDEDVEKEAAVNVQKLEAFCQQALAIMRRIIPKNIFYVTEMTLRNEFHYSTDLAARLLQSKCLWLIALETADLHQICIADLLGRYAIPADLDLVESAALLSVLPKTFLKGDIDGDKRAWRKVLTVRVAQLYHQQHLGTLRRELRRHTCYSDYDQDQPPLYAEELPRSTSSISSSSQQQQSQSPQEGSTIANACLYVKYSSSSSAKSYPSIHDYEVMPAPLPPVASAQHDHESCQYEVMPSPLLPSLPLPPPPPAVFPPHHSTSTSSSLGASLPPSSFSSSAWPHTVKVIHEAELAVGELIGKGSFGIVRYGTWRGMAVALKSFRLQPPIGRGTGGGKREVEGTESLSGDSGELDALQCWQDFQQEVMSMTLVCHHAHVVQLVGVVEASCALSPCIVTVFYPHGSLYDTLIKPHKAMARQHGRHHEQQQQHEGKQEEMLETGIENRVEDRDKDKDRDRGVLLHGRHLLQWALEAARGVFHLHQEGLIHRDLATRNLLLDDTFHVRVCDFGFSRVKQRGASRGLTRSHVGPVKWTSPEAMRQKSYSIPSDVFSFGVVLYEMFVQKEPWEGRDAIEVVLTVCAGERMVIPPSVPPSIARLMQSCWEHDPTARPSFEQILRTLAALQPV